MNTVEDLYGPFDWKQPDYARVYARRCEMLANLRSTPGAWEGIRQRFGDDCVLFINSFGMTFDPRNAEIGRPTVIPFLLFPKQAEYLQWVQAKWRQREDGLVEKSRDMGVSWLCVGCSVWLWLFHPGVVVGFGSRKEEYVDKIGDPKSLFWKIRQFIDLLPPELRPEGWDRSKHAPHMRIINPENESVIVGEAGDNIGRGNRTSIYFKDESAFLERAEAIEAALSQTSNCKIDLSTPNGAGNPFHRKRFSGTVDVFTFHWRDDPRKDQIWYEDQKRRHDPSIVAAEIDIDYSASIDDAFVPGELVTAAQMNGPAHVQAIGPWIISIDAGHFGDDESVVHRRRGRLNMPQIIRRGIDGVQLAAVVEEACRALRESGGTIGSIVIELDGPGVSCFDTLRQGRFANLVVGVHTGVKLKDDRNYNIRARMWRGARDYLEDAPVSLPTDPKLKAQLSAVKFRYKDGLLLMQSKKEYKGSNGESPDRADAFVLSFAAPAVPRSRSRHINRPALVDWRA